jgi:hypothetical protein
MTHICERCGRSVDRLIQLDDAEQSALSTEIAKVQWPQYKSVCITCVRTSLGITDADLIREERQSADDTEFHLNLVKGRLAQVLIEMIFQEFGYEVYPYGYESYLTNIIKHMRKGTANIPVRRVRATPDLFVYDREINDGYFAEVKATSTREETHYWMRASILRNYRAFWPEAFLVVYCIPNGHIYCKQVCDLSLETLPTDQSSPSGLLNYVLNLEKDFYPLSSVFRLIEPKKYDEFMPRLRQIVSDFGALSG